MTEELIAIATVGMMVTGVAASTIDNAMVESKHLTSIEEGGVIDYPKIKELSEKDNFRKKAIEELIKFYEKNGYIDYDQLELYNDMLNEHFDDLSTKGDPIEIVFGNGRHDDSVKIELLHDSILKHNP